MKPTNKLHLLLVGLWLPEAALFAPAPTTSRLPSQGTSFAALQSQKSELSAAEEAQRLLERSRALRREIALREKESTVPRTAALPAKPALSKWSLPEDSFPNGTSMDYRLHVHIGREPGTWMDPRWGASGKRIEFTLDVRFQTTQLASDQARQRMVRDNLQGRSLSDSLPVYALETAPFARLRSGFDQMKCQPGAFRIDPNPKKTGQRGSDTLRFYVQVEGTPEGVGSYGDLSVPKGCLYFSIPCFGSVAKLSTRGEMPVTVRQMGWHTGWPREESRIVGIFRAVPMEAAKQKDGF